MNFNIRDTVRRESTFETSDIYLAAYLKQNGLDFLGHRATRGKRILFCLRANEMLPDLLRGYEMGTGRTPPKALRDAVRDIKAIVKRAKDTPEPV